jgi:biotin-dependent carboxylase-like uncharacterized protein
MTPSLRIASSGLLTTVQDLGRPGYQQLGVPVGGALDSVSLRVANALVGNAARTAALEVAYVGPTLIVEADDARLSVAGARAEIEILPDASALRGSPIESMRSIRLHRGQALRIGSLVDGAVLYVAVEGGFDIQPVLGSLSTYLRGGFGGWQGRALVSGDELPLRRKLASDRAEVRLVGFDLKPPARIRVVLGPQSDFFSRSEVAAFLSSEYRVDPNSDRMGMRLAGRPIKHANGFDIVSDATAPGSVQVPGHGNPIVLLADRQTTGGYPKIATVISADIAALGRLPIGATIAFESVTLEAAALARRKHLSDIDDLARRIAPIASASVELTPRLLEQNLISGFVSAA